MKKLTYFAKVQLEKKQQYLKGLFHGVIIGGILANAIYFILL